MTYFGLILAVIPLVSEDLSTGDVRLNEVPKAYLGTIPDYAASGGGVRLGGVVKGGPADKAGLRSGDVVVKLTDQAIRNFRDYVRVIKKLKVGQRVIVVVKRGGKPVALVVVPTARIAKARKRRKQPKSDRDKDIRWLEKEWRAKVTYTKGAVTGIVCPHKSDVTDEVVEVIATFPQLKTLKIMYGKFTDKGMKPLASLKKLQEKVTDSGLKELAPNQDNLTDLSLSATKLTDAGLKKLVPGFNNLTSFDLSHTRIGDAGLKELAGLRKLTNLYLHRTHVTDAGMKELVKIKSLTTIDLRGTKVTDDGLKDLPRLTKLTYLNLSGISDVGLKQLAKLKKLIALQLYNSRVTVDGEAKLRKALPKCRIQVIPLLDHSPPRVGGN